MYAFFALLYGGPDTFMPLASALAAVIGVLLMVWNRVFSILRRFVQSSSRRLLKLPAQPPPKRRTSRHRS
jgi:hypothetical protein